MLIAMLRKRKNTVMHLSDLKKSRDKMQNKAAPDRAALFLSMQLNGRDLMALLKAIHMPQLLLADNRLLIG